MADNICLASMRENYNGGEKRQSERGKKLRKLDLREVNNVVPGSQAALLASKFSFLFRAYRVA